MAPGTKTPDVESPGPACGAELYDQYDQHVQHDLQPKVRTRCNPAGWVGVAVAGTFALFFSVGVLCGYTR